MNNINNINNINNKVIITGMTGFTGQYMAQNLINYGYEVHGLVRKIPETLSSILQNCNLNSLNLLNLHVCDFLNDSDTLLNILSDVKPDIIIHLAAIANVAHGSSLDFYQHNVLLTENLIKTIARAKSQGQIQPQAILVASSANVYGNNHSGLALAETTPVQPANHYAMSKIAMEQMLAWYDLPIIITRPFNYTGVGQSTDFLIPKIVAHFKAKKPWIELGNINVNRDFSDVRDVVNTYRLLIEKFIKNNNLNNIFNVCSGQTYSLKQVIEMMQEIAGYQIDIQINQKFVRSNDVKVLYGDNQKINNYLYNKNTENIENIENISKINLIDTLKNMYNN